jgi:hypothetical protein
MIKNFFLLIVFVFASFLPQPAISQNKPADVYSIDPDELLRAKELLASQSPDLMPAYKSLIAAADKFLKKGPFSVMQKEKTPPSGDKHDYLSLSIYSWPNPKTKDGLPYVTRDGEVNPESKIGTDAFSLVQMCDYVLPLALAYYLSGNEKYSEHAAELLRAWFMTPATKMNPNLKYAQVILGKNDGSPGGIIDSRNLINVTEAAGLLEGSKSWTDKDRKGLQAWFKDFLNWLLTSENGMIEGKTTNNHLTFYKAQVINFELFTGDNTEANKELENVKDLIASQIEPDGTQPLELNRTKSFNYSVFNLQAFFLLTEMGKNSGVDLYNYQTGDGRSIRKALDFIAPYTDTTKKWPYKEIAPISEGKYWLDELFRIASLRFPDGDYETLLKNNFSKAVFSKQWNLLYPVK